jgi:hypothetical protein
LFECHSGADGVISEPGKAGMSCNALFPRLTSIPARRRELVMTHTDAHGSPALSSGHGVCASGPHNPPNAYDWSFCWRDWDALQAGRLLRRRSLGRWSDGTPVTPLTIA